MRRTLGWLAVAVATPFALIRQPRRERRQHANFVEGIAVTLLGFVMFTAAMRVTALCAAMRGFLEPPRRSPFDEGRLRQLLVLRNLVRPLVPWLQAVHLREAQDFAVLQLSDNDPWIDALTSNKLHYFVLVVGEPCDKTR